MAQDRQLSAMVKSEDHKKTGGKANKGANDPKTWDGSAKTLPEEPAEEPTDDEAISFLQQSSKANSDSSWLTDSFNSQQTRYNNMAQDRQLSAMVKSSDHKRTGGKANKEADEEAVRADLAAWANDPKTWDGSAKTEQPAEEATDDEAEDEKPE